MNETCPFLCKFNWKEFGQAEPRSDEDASTNKYAATGIAFHQTMEQFGISHMKRSPFTIDACHNLLDCYYDAIPFNLFKDEVDKRTFYDSLHSQLNFTYEKFNYMPIFVEHKFSIPDLIPGLPEFTGTIDRAEGNMLTHDVDLIDWKSGKTYTKKELSSNMQAAIYALAFKHEYGFYPKRFIFVFSKAKKLKIVTIDDLFIDNAKSRILGNWYKIANGQFDPPAVITNKHFCKNFCAAYEECPKMKRKTGWQNVGYEFFRPEENGDGR